jgi:hypothetical protein
MQVDIAVIVNGEGRVVVDYMAELFDEPTIARIFDSFSSLLASMAAAPDAPVASADLFPAGGLRQLLSDLAPGEARPDHLTSPFVHAAFEAHAAAEPDRPCLVFEGTVVTYGEANARANRLAHALAAAGASKGTPIGIMLDRSPELLIAMLAAWKVRRPLGPFCWACMPLLKRFCPLWWSGCLASTRVFQGTKCVGALLRPVCSLAAFTCPWTPSTPTSACRSTWRTPRQRCCLPRRPTRSVRSSWAGMLPRGR